MDTAEPPQPYLLAVDVGPRCGIALFDARGCLVWHQSRSFNDPQAVRRTVRHLTRGGAGARLGWLITRGEVQAAAVWERAAMREGVRVQRVSTDAWQARLLAPGARRSGATARRAAYDLARRVIGRSGAAPLGAGREDSADAIMVGLFGALTLGWLGQRGPAPRRAAPARRAAC